MSLGDLKQLSQLTAIVLSQAKVLFSIELSMALNQLTEFFSLAHSQVTVSQLTVIFSLAHSQVAVKFVFEFSQVTDFKRFDWHSSVTFLYYAITFHNTGSSLIELSLKLSVALSQGNSGELNDSDGFNDNRSFVGICNCESVSNYNGGVWHHVNTVKGAQLKVRI